MQIVEGFFRFCNAMYLGMMLEKLFYTELNKLDIVLIVLNAVTLLAWIMLDIQRMMREVQE